MFLFYDEILKGKEMAHWVVSPHRRIQIQIPRTYEKTKQVLSLPLTDARVVVVMVGCDARRTIPPFTGKLAPPLMG